MLCRSRADVSASAKELLDPRQMIRIIVGDREKLEPALPNLNMGEIVALQAHKARLRRHTANELACPWGGALDPGPVVRVFLRSLIAIMILRV